MTLVHIVTDSTSDIPTELASDLSITVIPCQVYLGNEAYWDGLDLQPEVFHAEVARNEVLPRTSHPPVGQFAHTYRRLLEVDGEADVLSIHIAGTLSGTVNAAWAAAQMLPDPSWVQVVDTGQLSMGTGWSVIEAARMAKAGASRSVIAEAVEAIQPRVRVMAMIDTLENLRRGGRISQVSAALATVLRIKPLLSVERGRVRVLDRVRTRSRALERLLSLVLEWGPLCKVAVLHTGAKEMAEHVAQALVPRSQGRNVANSWTLPAGAALTTHLGPGAVGVCALVAQGS
jgi:DegV family protein with EDD domain